MENQPPTTTEAQIEAFDCPVCTDPFDREYCHHEADRVPLAKALCVHFQGDDENWGDFLDDAEDLFEDAGPGPYRLIKLDNGYFSQDAFLLNNLIVTIGEGGKDTRATPEIAARLPESVRIEVTG